MKSLLIVDDHAILREGIKSLILAEKITETVWEAASFRAAQKILEQHTVDNMVVDINLPDRSGLELAEYVKTTRPKVNVLIFSMHPDEHFGLRALKAGAKGYINKAAPPQDIVHAIRSIVSGKRHVTPRMAELLAEGFSCEDPSQLPHEKLTNRELQILGCFAQGHTTTQISERLNISRNTVNTYRSRLMQKLNVSSTAALVRYAIQNDLF